jgi:REP element-mobilizing transposase RayT
VTQRRIHQDEYPYFVTFRTKKECLLFEETKYAKLLTDIIVNSGKLKLFDILAYQIMPDHIHLLVNSSAPTERRTRDENKNPLPRVSAPAVFEVSAPAVESPTISNLIYTIKSYFLNQLRKYHDIPYSIFQSRFYTRIVNNQRYLKTIILYIQNNPIKAELSDKYHQKPYQYFNWPKIHKLF